MHFKNSTKYALLLSAIIVCIVSSIYLLTQELVVLPVSIVLSILTIITPLASSLYIYRGKTAKVFFIVALIAGLFAVVALVDASASQQTFKEFCGKFGSNGHIGSVHHFSVQGDFYLCEGQSEIDSYTGNFFTSPINAFIWYPYALLVFINILNLLYLPIKYSVRRFKKR